METDFITVNSKLYADNICIAEHPYGISNSQKVITKENLEYYHQELLKLLRSQPLVEHKCKNCGGSLEMRQDDYIFKCPYCGSVYAIGTAQINSRS